MDIIAVLARCVSTYHLRLSYFHFFSRSRLKLDVSHCVSIQLTGNTKTKTKLITCRRKASGRKRRGKCVLKKYLTDRRHARGPKWNGWNENYMVDIIKRRSYGDPSVISSAGSKTLMTTRSTASSKRIAFRLFAPVAIFSRLPLRP